MSSSQTATASSALHFICSSRYNFTVYTFCLFKLFFLSHSSHFSSRCCLSCFTMAPSGRSKAGNPKAGMPKALKAAAKKSVLSPRLDGNVPGSIIINPKNSAPKKPSRIDRSRSTPAATRAPTKPNEPPSPALTVDSDNNPLPASFSSPVKL